MSVINYKKLKKYLEDLGKDAFALVYLIYGEELLYKTVFEELLNALIPGSKRTLNYDPIDGADENIHEVIERINTFSLLPGGKVVAIRDSRIFYSKHDENRLLEKAKEAYDDNDILKSAKYFISFLGLLNLSYDDVSKTDRIEKLKLNFGKFGNGKWQDKIISYCLDNSLTIPAGKDDAETLQKAIEKGFPNGNHLIITTDMVDKRRSLFKIINEKGMIVDCSVPKGDRKADKIAQEAVLDERMKTILTQSGKEIDKSVYPALCEMTGFNLRTFSDNLEKLINYIGDRKKITISDVESVLKRTKLDPIYELTNSVTDRNIENSLFYLNSLLSGGDIDHPLQLLAAITNQIRKLLVIKDFVESSLDGSWNAGVSFNHFQRSIMPMIKKHDELLLQQMEDWEKALSEDVVTGDQKPQKKKTKKKSKSVTDLLIAKNPNNPYPVYKMMQKSVQFSKQDLLASMEHLSKADLRLKTTGQNPKLILEEAIFFICQSKN